MPEAEKTCSCCGGPKTCIGEDESRELDFIPARLEVKVHVLPKYACPKCRDGVTSPPVPPKPIPGGIAGAGLVSFVITSKFADHLPLDGSAQISDRTESLSTLGLWGPRARDILSSVTSADVSHEAFGFATFQELEIGSIQVLASRISYVGDLGWELYVPIEQGAKLWDTVAEAAAPHGAVAVGAGVYGSTGRLEKGYRAYGAELEGEYDVVEAGMAWGKVKDQDFIGKRAHVAQRSQKADQGLAFAK